MKIQKWLLPNKTNKYHPHLLRPVGLLVVVGLLLGINLVQNLVTAQSFQVLGVATDISSSDVISLQNQQRTANGLAPLNTNSKLMAAAQAKAEDMFADDYWAHYAPDGLSPWDFITQAGYSYSTAGENLAKDFDTSAEVVQGWMNSAPHRANVLNSSFVDVGVAVMNGTLLGSPTTLVVAEYGAPSIAAAAAAAPAAPAPPVTHQTTAPAPVPASVTQPAPVATAPTPTPTPPITPTKATSAPVTTKTTTPTRAFDGQAVSIRQSRTWAQNATLFIMLTLFLVSVLKHTAVWRTKKRGLRHIWLRAHPAAQYAILLVAIAANLASGVGVVR